METQLITEKLTELIARETKEFAKKDGTLKEAFAKFSKIGIVTKSTYSLPLKDTIGRTFREQIQFKGSEENPGANTGYMQ